MKTTNLKRTLLPFACVALALLFGGCASVDRQTPQASGGPGAAPDDNEGLVTVAGGRVAAELVAIPEAIRPGERLVLQVVNRGETGLSYGRPIIAERWDGAVWAETEESRDAAWTMELLYVAPGGTGVEQPWPFLPDQRSDPGWYRFSKEVQVDSTNGQPERLVLRVRVKVRE